MGGEQSKYQAGSVGSFKGPCDSEENCKVEGQVCCAATRSGFSAYKLCAWQHTKVVPTGTVRYGGYSVTCPEEDNIFTLFMRGELFVEATTEKGWRMGVGQAVIIISAGIISIF